MEPILMGDVLLTKSSKHRQKRRATQNKFIGGSYGCEVEQYRGPHHGANRNGGCGLWRVAGDWLRLAGGLKAELI